jgi:uncharacterized protein (DUF1330 family)
MPIDPTPEQIANFAKKAPDGSIYMLNLLKFKDIAVYDDGRETALSGAEAYGLYGAGVSKLIAALGGRFTFMGTPNCLLIGEGELAWDAVGIVEYPSLEAFQQMTASDAYADIHVHRAAGLDHQLLINCLGPGQQSGA